jgi:hypothetical protein
VTRLNVRSRPSSFTVAPGRFAPCGSLTCPLIAALLTLVCACAAIPAAHATRSGMKSPLRILLIILISPAWLTPHTGQTKTPSISCWKIEGVRNSIMVIRQLLDSVESTCLTLTPLTLSRSFTWSLPWHRQGFLTSGSNASLHGLPSLLMRPVTEYLEATQLPVHSGGNRLGISPNFPCRPQWAPATVQLAV